jgi:hypothetical protein
MSEHETQIRELDKKITVLSDTLARLGKGTTMQDLQRIIRNPGYTMLPSSYSPRPWSS